MINKTNAVLILLQLLPQGGFCSNLSKQGVAALKPSGLSTADDDPGDENSLAYSGRKLGTEKSKSLFTVSGMSTPGSEVG